MSVTVALRHSTVYRYDRAVRLSPHLVRLRPAPHARTSVDAYRLSVEPGDHLLHWQRDAQANHVARVVFQSPTEQLRLSVELAADLAPQNPFDFLVDPRGQSWPPDYGDTERLELAPYLQAEDDPDGALAAWIEAHRPSTTDTIDLLVGLTRALADAVAYEVRLDVGVQTPAETLARGIGSCRDTGWLLVQILRRLGFAARFVSGYLVQLRTDDPDEPRPVAEDTVDLHAWCEVFLPGAGWIGFDPTSGFLAAEGHIPLAAAPTPAGAAPLDGSHEPCSVTLAHDMAVTRLSDPTVFADLAPPAETATHGPYSAAQWAAIDRLGRRLDAEMDATDLRLTMGGEPTFVSDADRESPQWHYTALAEDKRALAEALLRRLADRFAGDAGSLLHRGLGKQYPGEPLPRWALACVWRTDGQPLWRDRALLEPAPGDPDPEAFLAALAARLGAPADAVLAAYEDPYWSLWRERGLPVDVEPGDARLAAWDERARLAGWLDSGALSLPTAWLLPLAAADADGTPRWTVARWQLRGAALFLVPGERPAGDRIPWASLPIAEFAGSEPPAARDPFDDPPPLPAEPGHAGAVPGPAPSALTAEARDGTLHLHLPELGTLEAYAALLRAIEDTAAALGQALSLEGAAPPADRRVTGFQVAPDPGVVEVNLQPADSWDALVAINLATHAEARAVGLSAEKFHRDGRPIGTGGGDHLTLGGPTPEDSPVLRRPDLLRSLLAYWNNHPALSYLFAGLFVGPTSQAPRVDEARDDALDELEIAGAHLPARGDVDAPPWLVDRLFRNLLVDPTGNTHRAEFCIDKLYAPETPWGRCGLVELRGFEMTPSAEAGLMHRLLVRALVTRFWEAPYDRPLARWGAGLHDRFLLPHYVEADLGAVLSDLADWGFGFDPAWFAPQLALRFPVLGRIASGGASVEVRQALEPWPVLGEQPGAAGPSRTVDPSMDRVQIAVEGLAPGCTVAVNGIALPLAPVGPRDRAVAGVRYRAWAPPLRLHPTVPVHAPLHIELVEAASGTRLAGARLAVGPAAGPVPPDAQSAEAARLARFLVEEAPAAPSPLRAPPEDPPGRGSRITLDLRRVV